MNTETNTQPQGIDYETALANLRASSLEMRDDLPPKDELLSRYHPDYQPSARVKLPIGPNAGDYCHPDLAKLLISQPLIDDYDLSGAEHLNTDVLVIGGGGAGAAAALSATEQGARVIMANKLRIGDSNTVMAEGGIQAAVGAEDSLQQHFDDTVKGGHNAAKKSLVAQMVTDAPCRRCAVGRATAGQYERLWRESQGAGAAGRRCGWTWRVR